MLLFVNVIALLTNRASKKAMTKLFFFLLIIYLFTSCVQFKKVTTSFNGNCRQLKKYSDYESNSIDQQSKYIFESIDLTMLMQVYNLNKLVDEDELVTIINLLEWTHKTIPYSYGFSGDKTKTFCNPRNALTMLKNKDDKNIVFVCRDMATCLTEIYLSLGFKARTVTCISRYSNDNDVHVVTEVYCNKLNKWIMVDPSFNAYVINSNNQILNLYEIRDHFANKLELKTNSGVNINNCAFNSNKYLKYMSRVCFEFERAIDIEFGIENISVKRMMLIPKGYSKKKHSESEYLQITNNTDLFWN